MKLKECEVFFYALADQTRLRILSLLGEGELCVCDVMSVLREPQSKISRHLAYLRKTKLVKARKEGMWMYYQLTKPASKTLRIFLETLGRGHSEFEELKSDRRAFQKIKKCLVACCS